MKIAKTVIGSVMLACVLGPAASQVSVPPTMAPQIEDLSCLEAWPAGFLGEGEWLLTLAFLVNEKGELVQAKVNRSSGVPELDQAVLSNVQRCTFRPARVDGKAVAAWSDIRRRFVRSSQGAQVQDAPRREPKE